MINYSQYYKSSNKQRALIPEYLTYYIDRKSNKQYVDYSKYYDSIRKNAN